ncbi:MAG: HAD-IA family hydrolase [Sneathiella sp.]
MKVLLFDLGGVVINWTGLQEMQKLLKGSFELEEIRLKMVANDKIKQFEKGQCSAEDFAQSFIADFNLPFEPHEFLGVWASWVGKPYEGVWDKLNSLKSDFKLVCVSNTNEVHWHQLLTEIGIEDIFEHCYASHLLHMSKPDPGVFETILADLDVAPEDVCFFDDATENIVAAEAFGLHALIVDAEIGVLPVLEAGSFFKELKGCKP